MGSWAGNLMLFKRHREFPSDINVILAGAGARLTVVDVKSATVREMSMEEFWEWDFVTNPFVILSLSLQERQPSNSSSEVVARSFRVAQRARNSHPHANAAMVTEMVPQVRLY